MEAKEDKIRLKVVYFVFECRHRYLLRRRTLLVNFRPLLPCEDDIFAAMHNRQVKLRMLLWDVIVLIDNLLRIICGALKRTVCSGR
jgi:hypothetical protein